MANNVRVTMAFEAMEILGIPKEKVKPVLKNLLKLYDNKWELIEEQNYQVLADAIFEYDEEKAEEANRRRDPQLEEDSCTPLKRIRLEQHEILPSVGNSSLVLGETSSQRPNSDNEPPQTSPREETAEPSRLIHRERRSEPEPVLPELRIRDKRNEPTSPQACLRQEMEEPPQLYLEDRSAEPVLLLQNCTRDNGNESNSASALSNHRADRKKSVLLHNHRHYNALIKAKSEQFTDESPQFKVPIAVIHPPSHPAINNGDEVDGSESMSNQHANGEDGDRVSNSGCQTGTGLELANISEASPAFLEIASSPLGDVKILLSCNSAIGRPDFRMPSLRASLKMVEDRFVKSYKISDPNFSLMKLMGELCQCFLQLGTESTDRKQEKPENITPPINLLKKSNKLNALGAKVDRQQNFYIPASSLNGSLNFHSSPVLDGLHRIIQPNQNVFGQTSSQIEKRKDLKSTELSNSRSLVVVQQHELNVARPFHYVKDISKGEERIKISLVNEINKEIRPPLFFYIPKNMVYQNAYINFSLARIGDEDCCSNCCGNCMSSPIPCACARETRGEFAYTREGLVKEEFLDECISMSRDPEKHRLFYCKDCPIERSKNEDIPDSCKGHLVRKFIKECWSKCGCNKQCGNRVVQRGITCNLQVFLTPGGKGWGLRTLKELPRGTFVCEYVGEIVTNTELYERNIRSTGNEKHTYPVLLDADWGSEGVLKDEEALCLDATLYGNVARFINHRCCDANLVEIPVEVETPDHHYYHLAFFTTRKIDALEELTWDYGLDFADLDHPVKAFRCRCGSKSCRDMTHVNRTKSKALILRKPMLGSNK